MFNKISKLALAAAAAACIAAPAAAAQQSDVLVTGRGQDLRSIDVSYRGMDLNDAGDVARLSSRLHFAARRVCAIESPLHLAETQAVGACRAASFERARTALTSLTARGGQAGYAAAAAGIITVTSG